MNAKVITAVLATFVMLFAGVAVADDADAGEAPVLPTSASFKVVSATYVFDIVDSKFPSLEDLGATLAEGKEFKGWYVDGSKSVLYMPGSTIASSEAYVALVEDVKYTVTFLKEDGTKISEKTNQTIGTKLVPPAIPDAPEGKVVVGWTDADGNPVELDESKKVVVTGDMTLKATYKADLKMTFVVDGITTYTHYLTGFTYPTDPVKENFTFLGWAVDGKMALVAGATVEMLNALDLKADTTFVASFEPALHVVTFVADGKEVLSQTVRHGDLAVEPVLEPVKDGFVFAGWNFDFKTPVVADVTVEAVFEEPVAPAPVMHTVSYVIEDKVVYTVEVEDGQLISAPDFIPSVEGKVFVEWKFDFRLPVTADLSIEAVFEDVVPPEPTGMDDPVVKTVAILAGIVILVLLAVTVSKIKKGEPVLGIRFEKAKKEKKEGEE